MAWVDTDPHQARACMITLIDHALHDSGIGSVLDGTLSVLQFSHPVARLASASVSWPTAFQVAPEFQKKNFPRYVGR